MCGGTLEINAGESVATCDYCGTQQTLPRLDDERKANMYDRANHFRRNNEFDKAMGIYEQILNEDSSDAEAYWSLVLCRFGIEYVEDPATHKRVPTINRAQYTSVFDDDNYKSALNYADSLQKAVYEQEARTINEIQKGILEISQKEEPFDVFVCYKETDNNGRRTPDSVLANDLYHQLTQEGFKVFFARITLEDKLGSAYEPYIFAALNSAKVMVVLGTKPEYFSAVWVKNEWSRYLSLIKQGEKKILIPAYKDMDPYDLPEEFSHLQAQDMSKLGFMQDLIRGIKKITQTDAPKETVVRETVTVSAPVNNNTAPLLKRAAMFLEDKNWQSANEYCQKVLDMDPECATAYLYLLLAELEVSTVDELEKVIDENGIAGRDNYKKAIRFGDAELKERLEYLNKAIIYNKAESHYKRATTAENYKTAKAVYAKISGFRDSSEKIKLCEEKTQEYWYNIAQSAFYKANSEQHYLEVAEKFQAIKDYKDSAEKIKLCKEKAIEATYSYAETLMDNGNYLEAINEFKKILDYKDSKELLEWCEEEQKGIVEEQIRFKRWAKIILYPIAVWIVIIMILVFLRIIGAI